MTLGGLALAVGILVDEATVVIENIHAHLGRGAALARASYDGTIETRPCPFPRDALHPRGLHLRRSSCRGRRSDLFIPLALAVGFAMVASYVLSSTLVPVLLIWVLRTRHEPPCGRSFAI